MTEFKKYNRKYIIVESFDDTKLPAASEVLGEGVVIVYTPSGELSEAEKVKIGDGVLTFEQLPWIGADEIQLQTRIVNPTTSTQNIVPESGYDGLSMVTVNPIKLHSKSVSPAATTQTIKPGSGYHGLSQVTVNACTGTKDITTTNKTSVVGYQYAQVADAALIAGNIRSGVNILGVTGSYEGGGLTVNDMSIGTVGAMPSGDLSLTVTDPSGNFAWKTYEPLVTQRLLPEKIIAGENILGVVGTGSSAFASVTAGVSLWHATGSGKDEEVAIYYMTPEGTQTVKLVTVPASAYNIPVSATFTTVINAPISVQVNNSSRQLSCTYSDQYFPLIGSDCGSTITYCAAIPGTANWPMVHVRLGDDLEALGALCDWDIMLDSNSRLVVSIENKHPSYYLKCTVTNRTAGNFVDPEDNSTLNNTLEVTLEPGDIGTFALNAPEWGLDSIYIDNVRWTANE